MRPHNFFVVNELARVNEELRKLYDEYMSLVASGDYYKSIRLGVEILEKLLGIARQAVLNKLTSPAAREATLSILAHHEQALSFVKGAQEAVNKLPPIYAIGISEEVVNILTSSINGLFSFVMGALVVVTDVMQATADLK